jgi:glycosyltransferase involved in cell wall biosynthesis
MNPQTDRRPEISLVVPLHNEEESVEALLSQVYGVLDEFKRPFEVILVDDGSGDRTFEVITSLLPRYRDLHAVRFRRNFGQTAAMAAGIDLAKGKILITMDGDLQNDPRDIPRFVDEVEAGHDLVVGWRRKRKDDLLKRKLPSWIANRLIGFFTGVPIKDNGCSLKAFNTDLVKSAPLYSDRHRFIPAVLSISGIRLKELEVAHHPRQFGQSKYGLSRSYKVILDLLAISGLPELLQQPVRYFGRPGLAVSLFGMLLVLSGLSLNVDPLVTVSVGVILMSSGIVMCFWGTLCEMLLSAGDDPNDLLTSKARYVEVSDRNLVAGP